MVLQHVPTTKLVPSTSQVVRGCVSFTAFNQYITSSTTRPQGVTASGHHLGVQGAGEQHYSHQNTAELLFKGWIHCVSLTDRMIQVYTLAHLVTRVRQAVNLQSPCDPVAGVSIFTKVQSPTTNGVLRILLCLQGLTTNEDPHVRVCCPLLLCLFIDHCSPTCPLAFALYFPPLFLGISYSKRFSHQDPMWDPLTTPLHISRVLA